MAQAPDRGLPAPDVVLYLDIPLEAAEQRGGYGQERYEKRELQQQVLPDRKCQKYRRADGCCAPQHAPAWRRLHVRREELQQQAQARTSCAEAWHDKPQPGVGCMSRR